MISDKVRPHHSKQVIRITARRAVNGTSAWLHTISSSVPKISTPSPSTSEQVAALPASPKQHEPSERSGGVAAWLQRGTDMKP